MNTPIWFNRPAVTGNEIDYMRQALEGGSVSGDGPFTCRCHALLQQITSARKALLTTCRWRRTALIAHMRARQFGGVARQCPQTEDVADRLVRLPLYFQLAVEEPSNVIEALKTSLPLQ